MNGCYQSPPGIEICKQNFRFESIVPTQTWKKRSIVIRDSLVTALELEVEFRGIRAPMTAFLLAITR